MPLNNQTYALISAVGDRIQVKAGISISEHHVKLTHFLFFL